MDMVLIVSSLLLLGSYIMAEETFIKRLKRIEYDIEERPHYHLNKATTVTVQIVFHKIGPLDESNFTFKTGFFLRQWWIDPRLKSNNSHGVIHASSMSEFIWTPDTTVADAEKLETYKNSAGTKINQTDGSVYWSRRLLSTTACNMNLKAYPMDRQVCTIRLENYAYTTKFVNTVWHTTKPVMVNDDLVLDGYELDKITWDMVRRPFLVGNETLYWHYLNANVIVKRTYMYHVYRVYIPSILLLTFTMGTFWVPATAVPARMGMIVTSFLSNTFILQTVTEKTVKVSYTTPMQFFLLMNVLIIVISLLEYLLILQLNERKAAKEKAREKMAKQNGINGNSSFFPNRTYLSKAENGSDKSPRNGLEEQMQPVLDHHFPDQPDDDRNHRKPIKIREMHRIDLICQWVFPIAYAVFVTTYFGYYVPRQ